MKFNKSGPLAKVFLKLPEDSPIGGEAVWAVKVSVDKYRIDNIPVYAYGFSLGDIVSAIEKDGVLEVQGPLIRGGHSTYRLFLAKGLDLASPEFLAYWGRLQSIGCTYEGAGERLLAIDVPPSADVFAVYRLLEEGENAGVWEFEEGYCGHPVAKEP